jgi:MFS family permease
MTVSVTPKDEAKDRVVLQLMSFTIATFLGFLAIGIPLPVLPGQVHDRLGFSTIVVGLVIGAQPLVTLLTRQYAGRLCDARGPKRAALMGFGGAACAGLCYLASNAAIGQPVLGLVLLFAGRVVLGWGESLFITALAAWAIARIGIQNAGRAMAWQGIAMYGAIAFGAPVGSIVADRAGFDTIASATVLFPLIGGLIVAGMTDAAVVAGRRSSLFGVLGLIWAPGIGVALASSGFGTIAAFLALRYQSAGWATPGAALTGFGVAYIAVRVLFGGLPDRIGGYGVVLVSLAIEALGLALLWHAGTPAAAFIGAVVTGLGYSLVFPSFGIAAVNRVAPEQRGLALGAYLACFDLGLALAGPVTGVAANLFGLPAAFLAAAGAAVTAILLTLATGTGRRKR